MDSQNTPTSGLPQPGGDMGQLPPIHAPQAFHAPSVSVPQFAASPPMPKVDQPIAPQPAAITPAPADPASDARAALEAHSQMPVTVVPAPAEETDSDFDEEWANKAREVVGRTITDPYQQSRELEKLKAAYIKARYNKDIKVSE